LQVALLKTALEAMLSKAVADREEMVNLLNRTYKLTPMTDVLALNTVLRELQDKVVQWEWVTVKTGMNVAYTPYSTDFVEVEKTFMPSERDLRRSDYTTSSYLICRCWNFLVTATHLKRLVANQDVWHSLDRNTTNITVSEADEKESRVSEDDSANSSLRPAPCQADVGTDSLSPLELRPHEILDDGVTPTAGIVSPVKNPMNRTQTTGEDDQHDSDSTIGAKKSPPGHGNIVSGDFMESSEMDSDVHGFISRLPRKSKPAARSVPLIIEGSAKDWQNSLIASRILSSGSSKSRQRPIPMNPLRMLHWNDRDRPRQYVGLSDAEGWRNPKAMIELWKLGHGCGAAKLSSLFSATGTSPGREWLRMAIGAMLQMHPASLHRPAWRA
jgi:1-phosphatidylinositol-3-phosphate 5-kinase